MVWLQGLLAGLALGGIYAIFALAVVVLFRTAKTVNFAQGNMGMFCAFLVYVLLQHTGLPLVLLVVIGVGLGGLLGVLVDVLLLEPNRSSDQLNEVFRTMAVSLLLFAVANRIWGSGAPYNFPSVFTNHSFRVAGFNILWLQVGIAAIALGVALVFWLVLRTPRAGLEIRAVASDRNIASLVGLRVRRVEKFGWLVAGSSAAITGILLAPLLGLSPDMMDPLLLKGFTAALLGGLTSPGGAIIAGFAVGILDAELGLRVAPEWSDIISFVVMLTVLLVRPSGLFGRTGPARV